MAEADKEEKSGGGSVKGLIIGMLAAALLAAGGGGGLAFMLAPHFKMEKNAAEKAAAEEEKKPKTGAEKSVFHDPGTVVLRLKPVMTNLRLPFKSWVRLEGALALRKEGDEKEDALARIAASAQQDIMTYLRTLSLKDLEGASNLAFLRDDLNERLKIRLKDRMREFMILSLVVE